MGFASMRRQATLAALAALALPAAPAAAGERADFALGLSPRAPGATGPMTLHVRFKAPGDPEGKPPPIRAAVFDAPEGTRFDASHAAACEASDAELQARGAAACPADSRLGTGTLAAMTGFGSPFDPVTARLDLFRTQEGLVEIVSEPVTGAYLGSDHLTINGSRLTAHPPRTPGGPPDGETAVRTIDWRVDRAGYVVAPPACPASGAWTASATFTFDGATERDESTTPCEPGEAAPAPSPSPPRSRQLLPPLLVSPARVRARRTARVTAQLAASARCRRGALVRVAGRRARTNSSGRAVLRVRLRRAGRYRVLAGRAHCPRRSAVLTATDPGSSA